MKMPVTVSHLEPAKQLASRVLGASLAADGCEDSDFWSNWAIVMLRTSAMLMTITYIRTIASRMLWEFTLRWRSLKVDGWWQLDNWPVKLPQEMRSSRIIMGI
jgi:hypothetical protein